MCSSNYSGASVTSVLFLSLKYANQPEKRSRSTPKAYDALLLLSYADVTHLVQSSCGSHEFSKRVNSPCLCAPSPRRHCNTFLQCRLRFSDSVGYKVKEQVLLSDIF